MTVAEQIEQAGGLVTIGGLARRWGLSRSTVRELVDRPSFPAPVAVLEDGQRPVRLWLWFDANYWRSQR